MADILRVPISCFFGNLPAGGKRCSAEEGEMREHMRRLETIELVRLYYAVPDLKVRRQFLKLVQRRIRDGPLQPGVLPPKLFSRFA
jgi:hypothetical protein